MSAKNSKSNGQDHISKGSQNSSSRNPAVGNVAGGGQQSPHGHQQPTRNPHNLFGQLLQRGKGNGISHNELINYLKWLTRLPGFCGIAENPSSEDVEKGFKQMLKDISQGGLLLQQIVETGDFPINLMFEIKNAQIPLEFVFVFYECPSLIVLQKALCMPYTSKRGATAGFIRGFVVHPDGHLSHFKQSARDDKSDPTHMNGAMVIVFPSSIGELRLTTKATSVAEDPMKKKKKFDTTDQYYGQHKRDEWPGVGPGGLVDPDKTYITLKPGEKPTNNNEIDYTKRDKVLRHPNFLDYYRQTMMDLGGVPIPVREHQDAAEAVPTSSELQVQQSTRDCRHGIWGGGEVLGNCKKCDWGED